MSAYAAAAWAFAFAALSFYWAAGGTAGIETLGEEIEREALARDAGTVALVWLTGALKVLAGALALALARAPRRRLLRVAAAAAAALLLLYAAANFVQHGLMAAGAVDTPEALGEPAVTWHLALWDPVWLLGGILFAAAARRYAYIDVNAGRPRSQTR